MQPFAFLRINGFGAEKKRFRIGTIGVDNIDQKPIHEILWETGSRGVSARGKNGLWVIFQKLFEYKGVLNG